MAFPMSLKLSEDQKNTLRQILEPEGVDASKMNPRHNTYPGMLSRGIVKEESGVLRGWLALSTMKKPCDCILRIACASSLF